jgi:VWFA-related protein
MRPATLLFALGLALATGAQQIPTIRVPVRLVTLPTLVISGENRLVPGLVAADFRVLDNGRPQTVALDDGSTPVSVVLAIQVNSDVREYVPFIARTGSVVGALLAGESGEAAVVAYGDEVTVVKPFEAGDVQSALRTIAARGRPARMIDAGIRAMTLLAARSASRTRVLLFIGQPMDSGSQFTLAALQERAEAEGVSVYALTLPEVGKAFVSDTFSLQGVSGPERGGFRASLNLSKLVPVLDRTAKAEAGADPFSILTAATGGTQLHFRKQRELEDAIAAVGVELRSSYLLSFYPESEEPGYHSVEVEVDVPGAKVYSRPGYWLSVE